MRKLVIVSFCLILVLGLGSPVKNVSADKLPHLYKEVSVHDPSIIKDGDMYYVFGTHGGAAKSSDLMDWEYFVNDQIGNHTLLGNIPDNLKEVFNWSGNPKAKDVGGMGIWAPDVYYNEDYINTDGSMGAYLMYFSISTGQDDGVNEHYRSLIGIAASQNIEGPYDYVDTVIYTGFKNEDGLSSYKNTDFNEVFPGATPRNQYFKEKGSYDFDRYPNAIDPTIVKSHDGKLYMVYGSWNAGAWIIELDPGTGMPLRPDNYDFDSKISNVDPYFGKQVSGGFWTSGEGPYIRYHEDSGYYHLYITYGGLLQNDTYNVRFYRSKNIDGPYEDINGKSAIFTSHRDNAKTGNRLLGSFEFLAEQSVNPNASFYGYRVPGHNSVLYDDNGKDFLITHTRFKDKGEGHQVRVHEMFFNEEGWPMIATQRYHNEDEVVNTGDISGSYLVVRQEQDNSKLSKNSLGISLEKDGTITGQLKGNWIFENGKLKMDLANKSYSGYVSSQVSSINGLQRDLHFTLLGYKGSVLGESILGIRVSDKQSSDLLKQASEDLKLARNNGILANVKLPTTTYGGIQVKWSSSNNKVLSSTGVVQRQDDPVALRLTATLKYGEEELQKHFDVDVVSKDGTALKRNNFTLFILGFIGAVILGAVSFFVIRKKKA